MTARISQTQLPVTGMSCASCAARVERALSKVEGVSSVSVNLTTEKALIETNRPVDLLEFVQTVQKTGFDVPASTTEIAVGGMSCASCSARVERALQKVPGVSEANVNLTTERATITGTASLQSLMDAITATGFEPRATHDDTASHDEQEERRTRERHHLQRDVILAAILWVIIAVLDMVPLAAHWLGVMGDGILQFLLATLLLAGPGRRFIQRGLPALARRAPEMNSLVAVGSLAAYFYSAVATFAPSLLPHGTAHLYYEAAAGIITLVLLGRFLEAHAKGRTSAAIRKLTTLQARTARVLRDGTLHDLPIEAVITGDIIDIRPGDRIPVDGLITEGESHLDEAMITGEPMPVAKSTGDQVVSGTINQQGAFRFRATAVGRDTMLSHIIGMVEQAQGAKLPIQSLVNKITLWFVPAIMAIATLTFIVWLVWGPSPSLSFALVNAVAVLIAACPCAMGLATPTAIMVGTGKGAELGILFRKGEALQQLERARIVALDKTGTLTEGHPSLTDFLLRPGFERLPLLRRIAAVEARSEHPIARAIVQAAHDETHDLPELEQFESVAGMGVQAHSEGHLIHIGSERYMHALKLDLTPFAQEAETFAQAGKSPLYVAQDGALAALLAVADPIKATSPNAVETLHRLGMKVVMITGDHHDTAHAIAVQLGIDEVVSNVLPQGKVDAVQRLQKHHGRLAFVGDGINDAPALAQADIGIAVGNGTDIAMEAADIVLVSGQLSDVATALSLSRATLRTIRQNLFWAFAYNVVLIPIAAGALYPLWGVLLAPMFAAGAMALSSIFVLSNALTLRRFKAPT